MYHMELCKRTRKYTCLSTSAEDALDGLESKKIRIAYNSSNLKECSPMENDSGRNISDGNIVLEEVSTNIAMMQNGAHLNGILDTASLGGTMNSPPQKTEPDPDSIKMFVGQIPRSMDEADLKKMFEEFGPVFQLNVLRDKGTGQSKGCCFVTFFTRKAALDAQNALHNIKTMGGMHHPIQMKPADSEKRNEERKLFVGMVSKKCTENDVRMMFAPFGSIEDCTVLRDQNGQSKGCAFVTYANRQSAQNAIKSTHHSQTMEGCTSPVVVKFADTQKEKEQKKLQQMSVNLWNMGGGNNVTPQYLALLQQAAAAGNLGMLANLNNIGRINQNENGANVGVQQLLIAAAAAAASNNPGLLAALAGLGNSNTSTPTSPTGAGTANRSNTGMSQGDAASNNLHLQNLQSLAALAGVANNAGALNTLGMQNLAALGATSSANVSGSLTGTTSANSLGGITGLQNFGNNLSSSGMGSGMNGLGSNPNSGMDALSQAYSGIQQYAASFPNAFSSQTAQQLQQAAANSPAGKQTEEAVSRKLRTGFYSRNEGPEGANLFIYHLPQEFSDQDLMQTFLPFGSVISAKVFIDKQTNLSKCFGFVSYDNPGSAHQAIQAMNGFQIGMKRLKVQLKRPKNDNKPY